MKVCITFEVRRPGITARRLRAVVTQALRREQCPATTEVGVALVGDADIRRLNRRFLRKDRPTDVLAFPLERGMPGDQLLGEVVISVDRARVQARRVRHPLQTEISLLAVHGVLHLLGYDDTTPAAAARMARRQRQLMERMGIEVRG